MTALLVYNEMETVENILMKYEAHKIAHRLAAAILNFLHV